MSDESNSSHRGESLDRKTSAGTDGTSITDEKKPVLKTALFGGGGSGTPQELLEYLQSASGINNRRTVKDVLGYVPKGSKRPVSLKGTVWEKELGLSEVPEDAIYPASYGVHLGDYTIPQSPHLLEFRHSLNGAPLGSNQELISPTNVIGSSPSKIHRLDDADEFDSGQVKRPRLEENDTSSINREEEGTDRKEEEVEEEVEEKETREDDSQEEKKYSSENPSEESSDEKEENSDQKEESEDDTEESSGEESSDDDIKFESFEPILMSQRLTLEEMLSRFSTLEVDRCIHDLRYPKHIRALIRFLTRRSSDLEHRSPCKEALKIITQTMPLAHPVYPFLSQLSGISDRAKVRIMALQYDRPKIRKCVEGILGKQIANWAEKNIEAVINFYTNNPVEFKSGQKSIWYDGVLVQDFSYETFHDENDGMERAREWHDEYGPGIMWIEKPLNAIAEIELEYSFDEDLVQKKLIHTMWPNGHVATHHYRVEVKLVGNFHVPIEIGSVLDDTGSSYLELYMEDAIALGLTDHYEYLGSIVRLETSNGAVFRLTFQVEVRPILHGEEFGEYVRTMACLVPTTGINQTRASGPFLRQRYFTGSSPEGHLVISKAKSNIKFNFY